MTFSSRLNCCLIALSFCWTGTVSFSTTSNLLLQQQKQTILSNSVVLRMGLYDKPLPPPPPPNPNRKIKNPPKSPEDIEWEEDDQAAETSEIILFSFDPENGKEVNGLLPPLGRRLSSGVDCYFEPTDRLVQNLVEKTGANVQDCCWALEACKGDITEAWTSISTARRMQLNAKRLPGAGEVIASLSTNDDDYDDEWDEESYELEMQEEYQRLKANRLDREKKRRSNDYFSKGEPDENWLPTKNPNPVDDEPWFTG